MERIERTILIAAPIERVFSFHDDTRNLLAITPPHLKVSITSMGTPGPGYEVHLTVRLLGLVPMHWHVRITEHVPPVRMTDVQVSGPFRSWKQMRFLRSVEGGTELKDVVEYEVPLGILGRVANALFIRGQIRSMFAYRQAATKRLLESA
jgi:ligand-binding SRPBCC domain-containing protein